MSDPSGILERMQSHLTKHSTASALDPDFSVTQGLESRLLAELDAAFGMFDQVPWLLEFAPVTSPSPKLAANTHRQRILFDARGLVWPFIAQPEALPLESDRVPMMLVRHGWQPGAPIWAINEWIRVLKPGGWFITLSANPWHPNSWRWLGYQAMQLPSWPHFFWAHQHPDLQLQIRPFHGRGWARWKLTPLLLIVARKRTAVAAIRSSQRQSFSLKQAPAAMAHCRAA